MGAQNDDQNYSTKLMHSLLFLVQIIVLCCFIGLLYGIFGNSMADVWKQPQPMSLEEQAKYRKARAAAFAEDTERVVDGIHVETGLVFAEGFNEVRGTCTACHSAKLVTQNKATRDGWLEMIRWMQQTQGLWDLGKHEPIILDYLAEHYGPEEIERRPGLEVEEIEWYILDLTQEGVAEQ